VGYGSNTVLGAVSVLGMGLIVWFLIPEPSREGKMVDGPPALSTSPVQGPDSA
jgi:hypothetical protein